MKNFFEVSTFVLILIVGYLLWESVTPKSCDCEFSNLTIKTDVGQGVLMHQKGDTPIKGDSIFTIYYKK